MTGRAKALSSSGARGQASAAPITVPRTKLIRVDMPRRPIVQGSAEKTISDTRCG